MEKPLRGTSVYKEQHQDHSAGRGLEHHYQKLPRAEDFIGPNLYF